MRNVLITGANRGLGLGLAKKLLSLGNQTNIIMACRNIHKGEEAIKSIANSNMDTKSLQLVQLDIKNPETFPNVSGFLGKGKTRLDMLVNNAAINVFGDKANFSHEKAKDTLTCNFFNQIKLIDNLLDSDCINQNGRIINYTSVVGNLRTIQNQEIKTRLQKASSVQELVEIGQKYIEALKTGEIWQGKNTMVPEYGFSKLLFTIYTEILAKDPRIQQKNIRVNAFCPGWVRTDMGGPTAPSSIEDASELFMNLLQQIDAGNQDIQGKLYSNKRFIDSR